MQVLDLELGTIVLHPTQTTTIRTKKTSENLKLIDAIFSFDLSFDLPINQKAVFMNKRGMIDTINIYQDGKRIMNNTSLPDLMELNCELFSEVSDLAHGNFFFGRQRHQPQINQYGKANNVQGEVEDDIEQFNQFSNIQTDNFPTIFNVANTFETRYNDTEEAIPIVYRKSNFSLYRYFMHTFIKNKMNDNFLFMPNLEIEIVFSPVSSFMYLDSQATSMYLQQLSIGSQAVYEGNITLSNPTLLIPMNQQIQLKEDESLYQNGDSDYFDQFENMCIKPSGKALKKVYIQQKKRYTNISQNLYQNFLLGYSPDEEDVLVKNMNITLKQIYINNKKIFPENIDMTSPYYYLFLTQNLKGTHDYKKNLLQTLMQTNVLAIDFDNQYDQKQQQKIDVTFKQINSYYMYTYILTEEKIMQKKNGIILM